MSTPEEAARNFLEDKGDGNAADFVTVGDLKKVCRAYLELVRREAEPCYRKDCPFKSCALERDEYDGGVHRTKP